MYKIRIELYRVNPIIDRISKIDESNYVRVYNGYYTGEYNNYINKIPSMYELVKRILDDILINMNTSGIIKLLKNAVPANLMYGDFIESDVISIMIEGIRFNFYIMNKTNKLNRFRYIPIADFNPTKIPIMETQDKFIYDVNIRTIDEFMSIIDNLKNAYGEFKIRIINSNDISFGISNIIISHSNKTITFLDKLEV